MAYGAETCILTKQAQKKPAAGTDQNERRMLNITYNYKDSKTNMWIRERTKVIYTIILLKSVCHS